MWRSCLFACSVFSCVVHAYAFLGAGSACCKSSARLHTGSNSARCRAFSVQAINAPICDSMLEDTVQIGVRHRASNVGQTTQLTARFFVQQSLQGSPAFHRFQWPLPDRAVRRRLPCDCDINALNCFLQLPPHGRRHRQPQPALDASRPLVLPAGRQHLPGCSRGTATAPSIASSSLKVMTGLNGSSLPAASALSNSSAAHTSICTRANTAPGRLLLLRRGG